MNEEMHELGRKQIYKQLKSKMQEVQKYVQASIKIAKTSIEAKLNSAEITKSAAKNYSKSIEKWENFLKKTNDPSETKTEETGKMIRFMLQFLYDKIREHTESNENEENKTKFIGSDAKLKELEIDFLELSKQKAFLTSGEVELPKNQPWLCISKLGFICGDSPKKLIEYAPSNIEANTVFFDRFFSNAHNDEIAYLIIAFAWFFNEEPKQYYNRCNFPDVLPLKEKFQDPNQGKDYDCIRKSEDLKDLKASIIRALTDTECFLFKSNDSFDTLLRNGWDIRVEDKKREAVRTVYDECLDADGRNGEKKFAYELHRTIMDISGSPEFHYFFKGNNTDEYRFLLKNNKELLKTVIVIFVKKEEYEHITEGRKSKLSFSVSVKPIFGACNDSLKRKIDEVVKTDKYSRYEIMELLSAFALRAKEDSNKTFAAETEEEIYFLKAAVKYQIIRFEDEKQKRYKFVNKWERIISEGHQFGICKDCEYLLADKAVRDGIAKNFVSMVLRYDANNIGKDHLNFRLAETTFFAISALRNANRKLLNEVIELFCTQARDYCVDPEAQNRLMQELSAQILLYVLYIDAQTSEFYLNAKMTDNSAQVSTLAELCWFSALAKQLYPSQVNLTRSLISSNARFRSIAEQFFTEALYDQSKQPYFYFIQYILKQEQGKGQYKPDEEQLLDLALRAQHYSWAEPVSKQKKEAYIYEPIKKACELIFSNFENFKKKDEFFKIRYNVISMQLLFYAISDLSVEEKNELFSTVTDKKKLLRALIYADYGQKLLQGDNYPPLEGSEKDLSLICGTYRVVNSFPQLSRIRVDLSGTPKMLKTYANWLERESPKSRYFWFTLRLLKPNFYKQTSHKEKLDALICKENYEKVTFLQYDCFPKTFDKFMKSFPYDGKL